jgi:hypothetical protein
MGQSTISSIAANGTNFFPGVTLVVGRFMTNPGSALTVDLYVGVLAPDGETLVFVTDSGFVLGRISDPVTFRPIQTGVSLSTPFVISEPEFLRYTWNGTEPAGSYVLFFAVALAGAFSDNSLDPGDLVALGTASFLFSSSTPPYTPYRPLMSLVAATSALYATGSQAVPPLALQEVGVMMAEMLRNRGNIAERLRTAGAVSAVFARTEDVCDLDYFADLDGTQICSSAVGGLGGVPGRPATACSEKNILKEPDDPFGRETRIDGENVCVHELAHTIMNVGLTEEDRARIRVRYEQALLEGLWSGDFALQNADEFFAEMSQTYFCANPAVPTFLHNHGINCAAQLQQYDPATYDLIHGIYGGSADLR